MDSQHNNRFHPDLGQIRDVEQRLTGLVPTHASPLAAGSLELTIFEARTGDGEMSGHAQAGEIAAALNMEFLAYQRQEQWLDDVLRDSFPASDPMSFQNQRPLA